MKRDVAPLKTPPTRRSRRPNTPNPQTRNQKEGGGAWRQLADALRSKAGVPYASAKLELNGEVEEFWVV